EDGALAATNGADQGDGLSWQGINVEVRDDGEVAAVAEGDVLVLDVAFHVDEGYGIFLVFDLGLCVEDLEDPVAGSDGTARGVQEHANLAHRLRELAVVLDESNQGTDSQMAMEDQEASVSKEKGGHRLGTELDERLTEGGDLVGLEALLAHGPIGALEVLE